MVDVDDTDDGLAGPDDGIGLCLSGGGYRAMLFHLGAIIRLNEIGLLPRLSRVSSVSGGSITAAYLGMRWAELEFDAEGRASNLSIVIDKIREMGRTSIDAGAIIGGLLLPGTISQRVAAAYDRVLFDGSTTDVFPADGAGPRFVINATNAGAGYGISVAIPSFALMVGISALEVLVAAIQAYVFALLTSLYINDAEHLH